MTNYELFKIIERIKNKYEYIKRKNGEYFECCEISIFEDIKSTIDVEKYIKMHGYDILLEKIADFYMDYVFKFCGCGIPEYAYKKAIEILELIQHRWDDENYDNPINKKLMDLLDNDHSVLYILYHFDVLELTEHGSSIYGSFITDYGKDFITIMKEYWRECENE